MPIEWMPRSRREEDGWRGLRANPAVPATVSETRSPTTGVRVSVRPQRWRPPRIPRLRGRALMLVVRVSLIMVIAMAYLAAALVRLLQTAWPVRVVVLVVLLVAVYRSRRLRRWGGHRREADVVLTADGVYAGRWFVPWSQVEAVVRFTLLATLDRGRGPYRNFVAIRVRDFVGVAGLSPFRAGLANLTRRHLLVLAEGSELRRPAALAAALEELVADPGSRAVLSTPDGCRFVDEGPAGAARRSP